MNNLQKKIAAAIAAASLIVNTALPVFATTIEIIGNGSDTKNTANVEVENTTIVEQSNNANISNDIKVDASTGGNEVNRNTGGDVNVSTGNAGAAVAVSNQANSNVAQIDGCCQADVDVLISGNGDGSKNKVDLDVNEEDGTGTYITQENKANVSNEVEVKAGTGWNEANRNTGGQVSITTGDAWVGVGVENALNSNSARIGGGEGGTMLSAKILGNGSDSKNTIDLEYEKSLVVAQKNRGYIMNDVDAFAFTGKNEANRNTGGDVTIDTGNAGVEVGIDNMANFNWADVSCDCLLDLTAKIAGNGDEAVSKIKADLDNVLAVDQDNCGYEWSPFGGWFGKRWGRHHKCGFSNEVEVAAKTGKNEAERNTGGVDGGDPSVDTGDSLIDVQVDNAGNSNVYGEAPEWDLDFPEFGFNLNLSLDWQDLLDWLMSHA